ncbi:class II peroxidase [Apiospora arundinis]
MARRTRNNSEIPVYTIDLAAPPKLRYLEVAKDFAPRIASLTPLFDLILEDAIPYVYLRTLARKAAKFCLTRLHDDDETQELRGISEVTGVDMYLLVALNTLLDCLLGCTSGAVPVASNPRTSPPGTRLMHFRTLDWEMPSLRDVLVELEFVNSSSPDPTKVFARSITYAGYVGVLTGVREGLSISMNFRPNRHCSARSLRWHQLMVLLGRRKCLSSILRSAIVPKSMPDSDSRNDKQVLARPVAHLISAMMSPCYLTLCDGKEVTVIEKDLYSGRIRSSAEFLVQTNHDVIRQPVNDSGEKSAPDHQDLNRAMLKLEGWLEESTERYDSMIQKWGRHVRKVGQTSQPSTDQDATAGDGGPVAQPVAEKAVSRQALKRWMQSQHVMGECTHFAAIMDPYNGTIPWIKRGLFLSEPSP